MTMTRARGTILAVVLFAGTVVLFVQSAGFPFVNFDDNLYVYENQIVRSGITTDGVRWAFTAVHASNWHPVTWLSHMLDVSLFGVAPGPHHLVNVLLHAATAVLLFLVLFRATGAPWRSLLAAALFAWHPLRVESVVWVSERKDVLSGLFLMLTVAAYGRYVARPGVGRYATVLLAFAVGLMAKPILVTVPFLLLLIDRWPLGRAESLRRLVVEKIPLVLLAAASSVATYAAQRPEGTSTVATLPVGARVENAVVAIVGYLSKTVWPADLAVFYPHPYAMGGRLPEWQVFSSILLIFGVSVGVVRWGRGREWLPIGWFWFLIGLVPVLGIVQVGYQAMADRYTYLPSMGLCVAAVWSLPSPSVGRSLLRRAAVPIAAALAVGILSAATVIQTGYWRSPEALFSRAVDVTRGNWVAWNKLGAIRGGQGRDAEAVACYREVVRINIGDAAAWTNMGVGYLRLNDHASAGESFRAALKAKPGFAEAHFNLGYLSEIQGRREEAMASYREALRYDPGHGSARVRLEALTTGFETTPRTSHTVPFDDAGWYR